MSGIRYEHPLGQAIAGSLLAHLLALTFLVSFLPENPIPPFPAALQAQVIRKPPTPASPPTETSIPRKHPQQTIGQSANPQTGATAGTAPQTQNENNIRSVAPRTTSSHGGETALLSHEPSSSPENPPSTESLRDYRLALGRQTRRFKQEYDRKYTQIERMEQKSREGRVELHVRKGPAGLTVLLSQSSGYPTLDEQAIELIDRAVRITALPETLRERNFLLPITLEFQISNPNSN